MFRSQDIQVFCIFNHPIIYQICDITMSIRTWDNLHFLIYLLNHNSQGHQTWSVDRYKQGQYFSVIFWTIWRTGARFQVLFNLATCPNYSITKYVKIPVFYFFEKVNKGQSKRYLLKQGMTWNNLKRPTTSKKWTWNNLQQATDNLKRPEMTWNNLQQSGKTYSEQETTWKWPRMSKKQPEMTHNE